MNCAGCGRNLDNDLSVVDTNTGETVCHNETCIVWVCMRTDGMVIGNARDIKPAKTSGKSMTIFDIWKDPINILTVLISVVLTFGFVWWLAGRGD